LQKILVVRLEVASGLASSGYSSTSTAALEVEAGILNVLEGNGCGRFGICPERKTLYLSEVRIHWIITVQFEDSTDLCLASASTSGRLRGTAKDSGDYDESEKMERTVHD
ncbi:hypothetical protein PMAYCL1PPCAC_15500, partial [Pristionchus mayeri]